MAKLSATNTSRWRWSTTELASGDIKTMAATLVDDLKDHPKMTELRLIMIERSSHYWDTYELQLDREDLLKVLAYVFKCDPTLLKELKS
jgi:hypothetical protein